jgi:hypothetical protein
LAPIKVLIVDESQKTPIFIIYKRVS